MGDSELSFHRVVKKDYLHLLPALICRPRYHRRRKNRRGVQREMLRLLMNRLGLLFRQPSKSLSSERVSGTGRYAQQLDAATRFGSTPDYEIWFYSRYEEDAIYPLVKRQRRYRLSGRITDDVTGQTMKRSLTFEVVDGSS